MTDTNTSGADVLAANEVLAYLPPAPAPKNGGGHNIDGTRILNQDGEGLDSEYSESELLRYGEACAKAAVAALIEREAALITERDAIKGYERGWRDLVALLGLSAGLPECSDAQFHASVVMPKLRELIAERDALAAEAEALREVVDLAVDNDGGVTYYSEEDEIGVRCCCHVIEYQEHESDCWVRRAKELISARASAATGGGNG